MFWLSMKQASRPFLNFYPIFQPRDKHKQVEDLRIGGGKISDRDSLVIAFQVRWVDQNHSLPMPVS